jgi:hypothetical protein
MSFFFYCTVFWLTLEYALLKKVFTLRELEWFGWSVQGPEYPFSDITIQKLRNEGEKALLRKKLFDQFIEKHNFSAFTTYEGVCGICLFLVLAPGFSHRWGVKIFVL